MAVLEVRELRTSFRTDDGIVKAVDGVIFSVEKGKTLGIVGESWCGKSVTCLSIMGLNNPSNTVTTGAALFNGDDLLQAGIPQGPEIGSRLQRTLDRKLDGELAGREQELAAALGQDGG